MKKTILSCALSVVMLFMLCCCSGKSTEKAESGAGVPQSFSATADITYGDLSVTAEIARSAADNITLTINSPEQLNGMQFSFDGTDTRVSYYGISFTIPKNTATAKALASAVFSAINSAAEQSGASVSQNDGQIVIEGKIDEGKYSVTLDSDTGAIVSLSMPDLNLECSFSDFKS